MSYSPLEKVKVDCLIQTNTTSSSLYSGNAVSMAGFDRADFLITVGQMPATGDLVQLTVVGGTVGATPSAMAALTNATVSIGSSSTKGTVWGAQKVRINLMASAMTTGKTIVIDGSTFTGTAAAAATAGRFAITTATSAVMKSLTTVIKVYATRLDATFAGTTGVATALGVDVWFKGYGASALRVATTAQATADGINCQSLISQGIVTIRAADLLATNASYTDVGVLVNCTGSSAIPVTVHCIRSGHGWVGNPPWNAVLHKKDLSTSGAK